MSSHSTALATTLAVTAPTEGPLRRHTHTYQLMRQCIHCGFCLPTCPTYALLGVEMDSPRGRIYQMQAVAEGRIAISPEFVEHMYCCLGCRACETACPSGVQFGKLIEAAREQIQLEIERAEQEPAGLPTARAATAALESGTTRLLRQAFFDVLLPSRLITTLFFAALKVYQRSGLQALVHATGLLDMVNALPTPFRGRLKTPEALMAPARGPLFARPLPEITPALGQRRYRVGFISGCIMDQVFRDVNEATIRVLAANGCEVITPPQQRCCGALHVHAGEARRGRELARYNIDVFEAYQCDAIIINSAGCGSNLKEYGHLLADDPLYAERAAAFSAKVKDISEFLTSIDLNREMGEVPLTITYHDACHLIHGQKIKQQPRRLLQSIPGLRLVELKEADWCCGSAGIYNITNQDLAGKLLARKMNNIAAAGAEAVVTGNPGCMMQIALGIRERGLRMQVLHPVELLDQAYRAAGLYRWPATVAVARRRRRRQRALLAGVGASAGAVIGYWLARRLR
ncbi:(Fe-S)-binding protein [Thermogemmatispora carboxidivorans]|uniref:(Fe-S)-binding protein n=1 Tax=Thermogemmatispora carboxidivorans TaxID=1382306 RepID=UPI00069936B0|nr:heterodisulfide reductase-related iron-sulfur binding cluster [Thermogemmatispora carboxidivorans]